MRAGTLVSGEVASHKVAAVFADEAAARDAARRLREELDLQEPQVQVITARDRHPGRRMELEARGIWTGIARSHVTLGAAGAVAGLAVAALLWLSGVAFVASSPLAAFGVALFFGAIAGMLLAGFISLRPDHDPFVLATREALRRGETVVVVHAYDAGQRERADAALAGLGGRTTATL